MRGGIEALNNLIANFDLAAMLDIAVLFVIFFLFFAIARKYNSSFFVWTVCILLFCGALLKMFDLHVAGDMVLATMLLLPIVFLTLFKNEIKREIWKRSNFDAKGEVIISRYSGTETEIRACISKITKAMQNMAKVNEGALIIIVPNTIPLQITESGTRLDADISSELIENIFTPNTPLHDGAMLVSGNKIMAAGCFLPLAQDSEIPKELGTRHRAAIGISDICDVLALVVSEETGIISAARRGKLKRYLDVASLTNELEVVYGIRKDDEAEEGDL